MRRGSAGVRRVVENAIQLAQFQADGTTRPEHWADQQPLYEHLLYTSPTLTDAQVPNFFKDATFGVKPEDVASTEHPRPGVTIVRDAIGTGDRLTDIVTATAD